MPAVRHPALRIHPFDGELQGHVLMARRSELAPNPGARHKGTVELDTKPRAELLGVDKSGPDAGARCPQNDLFLDTVGGVMQLHGCILARPSRKCNRRIAYQSSLRGSGFPAAAGPTGPLG